MGERRASGRSCANIRRGLGSRYVIHTVGPIWTGSPEDAAILKSAYSNSLAIAVSNKLRSIAFPSISTGAYCYPVKEASNIAVKTVIEHLKKYDYPKEVVLRTLLKGGF